MHSLFVSLIAVLAAPAHATPPSVNDCSTLSGVAPAAYDALSCGGYCAYASNTLTCDLSACGGASATTIVTDYNSGGSASFSAWGDCNGTTYCCAIRDYNPSADITTVKILGSAYDDTLDFTYSTTGDDLEPHFAATALTGEIHADDGDDTINGSNSTSSYFSELLYGDDDVDTIFGNDGADTIYGGAGHDGLAFGGGLFGGDGDDVIYGGAGNDEVDGESGDDILYGEGGIDSMWGRGGNDTMFGGGGVDVMRGDAGNDSMDGGDGADILKGGAGNDAHCDTSEDSTGSCTSNTFDDIVGNNTNDHFWLDFSAACSATGNLAGSSDAQGGTDHCGDGSAAAWPTTAPGGWPWAGCNGSVLTSKPSTCP